MITLRKISSRFAFLLAMTAFLAVGALAQNQSVSGDSTLGGSIANSVQIWSRGPSVNFGGNFGGSYSQVPSNNPIVTVINFGDISANNTTANKFVAAGIGIELRSNCGYLLRVSKSGNIPDGAANSGTFKSGDIGMAMDGYFAGGVLMFPGADSTAIAGTAAGLKHNFQAFPGDVTVTNGQPTFGFSLNNVGGTGSPTTLVAGGRISKGGDNTTGGANPGNQLTMSLLFAVKPQYYTPGTFSETLSISIVPNP